MTTKTKYEYFEDMVEQLKRIAEYLSVIAKAEYLHIHDSEEMGREADYYDSYRNILKDCVDFYKDRR